MAFESFSALIAMGGHGPYVWTCYGVFFLLLGLLAWVSVAQRRQVVRRQRVQQHLPASGQDRGADWGSATAEAGFQRIQSSHSESASKS